MADEATHKRIIERLGYLTVVRYAIVPPEIQAECPRYQIACSGTILDPAWVLAISDEVRGEGGFRLCSFNQQLEKICEDPCDSLDEAMVTAEEDYKGIGKHWIEVKP